MSSNKARQPNNNAMPQFPAMAGGVMPPYQQVKMQMPMMDPSGRTPMMPMEHPELYAQYQMAMMQAQAQAQAQSQMQMTGNQEENPYAGYYPMPFYAAAGMSMGMGPHGGPMYYYPPGAVPGNPATWAMPPQQQDQQVAQPAPQQSANPAHKHRSRNSSGSSSPLFQALNNNEYDDDNNWAPAFTPVDAASPHTLSPTLSSNGNGPNLSQELSVLGMLGLTPDKAPGQQQVPLPYQPISDLNESKMNENDNTGNQNSNVSPSRKGSQGANRQRDKRPDEEYRSQRWLEGQNPETAPAAPAPGAMPGATPEEMQWSAAAAGRGMVPMVPAALLPFLYNPMYAQLLAHWQASGGAMPMPGMPFPYDERMMRMMGGMNMGPRGSNGHYDGRKKGRNGQNNGQTSDNNGQSNANGQAQSRNRAQNTYSFVEGVLVVTEKDGARSEHQDLNTLHGRLGSLCRDQHGCRFVQRQLDDDTESNFPIIFAELLPELDPFGNYMVQKLIEVASGESRRMILARICVDAVSTACNMHGTRTIQKAVECLSDATEVQMFTDALRDSVASMVKDVNGNHVIQKCLSTFTSEQKQFIFDVIAEQCVDIATHRHGCCVMQRCFDHGSDAQKTLLVDRVVENTLRLVEDPFGNYVVQYILDLHRSQDITRIAESILGHISDLSTQKFSSNVIEKILQVCDPPPRALIIREMLKADAWFTLLQDPYANYVIQTAIQTASLSDRNELVDAIKPHLPSLRNTPYGKRIQSKITSLQQGQQQWSHNPRNN